MPENLQRSLKVSGNARKSPKVSIKFQEMPKNQNTTNIPPKKSISPNPP
jgi:hypothetical protein